MSPSRWWIKKTKIKKTTENVLTFVIGGSRSGKSAFAQQLAEQTDAARFFLAACPDLDAEMHERIRRHRQDRQGRNWQTIEEPLNLVEALGRCPAQATVLIDCLTLWISNLMHKAEQDDAEITEDQMTLAAEQLGKAACCRQGQIIMVANEVGLGIVPDSAAARRFRDLAGRCNQTIAALADQVFFVCCGIPLKIK
jgi:adenosylcobinamide kinase/adenosylcobinamide-phosphate guanylyltransferase